MALDAEWQSPAITRALKEKVFSLPNYRTEQTGEDPSPPPSMKSDPSSNSPNLPQAGGSRGEQDWLGEEDSPQEGALSSQQLRHEEPATCEQVAPALFPVR
jgi:hypothetical protein